jgi:TetR/AcrR family transcriptional repressor of uid operon
MAAFAELLARAAETDEGEEVDATRERILDAALAEGAAVGLARVTVEDVVRRSGLGRMTVYRRFPRRDDLIEALVVRETRSFLAAVAAGIDRAGDDDPVAEAFVAAVTFAREHPLLKRLAHADPGAVTETLAAHDAVVLTMGTAFIAARIQGDAAGPPSRRGRWTADLLARLFWTYLAIPPSDPDVIDDAELRAFAREILTPLIERAVPA